MRFTVYSGALCAALILSEHANAVHIAAMSSALGEGDASLESAAFTEAQTDVHTDTGADTQAGATLLASAEVQAKN